MGFFDKVKVSKPNCNKCGLHKRCNSPRMEYSGAGQQGILIISEAPTEEEDKTGKHFAGDSGTLTKRALAMNGLQLARDCWTINTVNCRPYKEDGKLDEIAKYTEYCRPYIDSTIEKLKPKKIVLLGSDVILAYYKGRSPKTITGETSIGITFWDSKYQAWVYPTFHPKDLLKNSKDKAMAKIFNASIALSASPNIEPLKKKFIPHKKLIIFEEVIAFLKDVYENEKLIALDYESTGNNVLIPGHKTVCVGIATPKIACAFLYEHPYYTFEQTKQIGELLKAILKKRTIKKIVHNIQFEYTWSKYVVGQTMNGSVWCTMIGSHMVDNRQGIASLKYQAFQRWGIEDYSSSIDPFLSLIPGTNFNSVLKVPIDKLLEYNALDCVYTMALYEAQQEELTRREKEAYQLFHKSAIIFSEMSYNGIKIDQNFYAKERAKLIEERDGLIAQVMNSDEVKRYNRKFGGSFNMDSTQDMQNMLFDIMGMTAKKKTAGGSDSVDADTLSKIDSVLTRTVIKIRKLNKVIGTYIDGFNRQATEGFMHPQFLLHIARSYRSSSKNPNFQNAPKRDKQANRAVRSGMVPEPGCVLLEADFSGAEIVTSCTYHRDPTFINYQMKEDADMHKDAASIIWKASKDLIAKPIRQGSKAGFVFSQFYGSYYVSCALKMWEEMLDLELTNGVPLRDHIKKQGITCYQDFENHIKKFERTFWDEWFPKYTQWKKDIYNFYLDNGYIETHFGFRFKGYMNRKQAGNYPIQGTSFHMLLYSLIKLDAELKRRNMKTKLVGQIHDSIIAQVPIEEIEEYCQIVVSIVNGLKDELPWLCVPMKAEIESSETAENGGSFASMKKIVG